MSDWFILYLLTRVDSVKVLFVISGGTGAIALVLGGIFGLMAYEAMNSKDKECYGTRMLTWWKRLAYTVTFCFLAATVTPSKNDILFIIGGDQLMKIARSDKAAAIGSKTLEAVEVWLDKNLPKKP